MEAANATSADKQPGGESLLAISTVSKAKWTPSTKHHSSATTREPAPRMHRLLPGVHVPDAAWAAALYIPARRSANASLKPNFRRPSLAPGADGNQAQPDGSPRSPSAI